MPLKGTMITKYLNKVPLAVLKISENNIVLEAHGECEQVFERKDSQLINTSLLDLFHATEKHKIVKFLETKRTNPLKSTEIREIFSYINQSDNKIMLEFVVNTEIDKNLWVNVRNVSRLLGLQRRLQVESKITRALAISSSLDTTMYNILRIVGQNYKWQASIFWVQNSSNGNYSYITHWDTPTFRNSSFIKYNQTNEVSKDTRNMKGFLKEKNLRWYHNFEGKKSAGEKEAYSFGVKKAFLIPILVGTQVVGLIGFYTKKDKVLDSDNFEQVAINMQNQLGYFIKAQIQSKKLAISEERYRTLVELAPNIIYTKNESGEIQSLNTVFELLTGFKSEDFIGKPLETLYENINLPEPTKDIRVITKNGSVLYGTIKETTVDMAEINTKIIGIINDITERKNLENQKDLLMGIATHELKSPLTSIKVYSQLIQKNLENKKLVDLLENINSQADEMTRLIDDFLDVTKIKFGAFTVNKKPIELKTIIQESVSQFKAAAPQYKIKAEVPEGVNLEADKDKLVQLFNNLISNAIKYSPNKDRVEIETERQQDKVLIKVTDYGMGIPKEKTGKIFELFYRGEGTREIKGTGLGLFISNTIVKAHQGDIWVESQLGKGSTFFVRLPLIKQNVLV